MPDVTADDLDLMERQLRRGLGPEAALVDIFKRGMHVGAFVSSEGGRAIVEECTRRIVECMEELTREDVLPTEQERSLVAFKLNVAILRRMAALVAAGEQAGNAIEQRSEAPREWPER